MQAMPAIDADHVAAGEPPREFLAVGPAQRRAGPTGEYVRPRRRRDDPIGGVQPQSPVLGERGKAPRERLRVHLREAFDGPVDVLLGPLRVVLPETFGDRLTVFPDGDHVRHERFRRRQPEPGHQRGGRFLEDHRVRPIALVLEQAERRDGAEAVADEHVRPVGVELADRSGKRGRGDLAVDATAAVAGLVDGGHIPAARGERRADSPPRVRDRRQPVDQEHPSAYRSDRRRPLLERQRAANSRTATLGVRQRQRAKSASKPPPGMKTLNAVARSAPRFSKSCVTPAGIRRTCRPAPRPSPRRPGTTSFPR